MYADFFSKFLWRKCENIGTFMGFMILLRTAWIALIISYWYFWKDGDGLNLCNSKKNTESNILSFQPTHWFCPRFRPRVHSLSLFVYLCRKFILFWQSRIQSGIRCCNQIFIYSDFLLQLTRPQVNRGMNAGRVSKTSWFLNSFYHAIFVFLYFKFWILQITVIFIM